MELNEVSKTDNTSLLSVGEAEEMLIWLDQFTLSRPTKKIHRDFADAVLLAEVLKVYYPKLVEMHNYPPRNSQAQKLNNWMTINRKVLKKLKLNICIKTMEQLANAMPGVIERVLVMVREKIKRDEANKTLENGENTLSSGGSCYETCGEEEQVFIVPIKRRAGDILEKIQKKVVSYDAYICLKEELRDSKVAVESLKQKSDHFEEIIKLKNIQIDDLQKQLDKKATKKRDEIKEQNMMVATENTSPISQSVSEPGSSRGSAVEVVLGNSKSEAICKEDLNHLMTDNKSLETPLPVKMEFVKQDIKTGFENNV